MKNSKVIFCLKHSLKKDTIISIFSNRNEPDIFAAGIVSAISENQVLIKHFTAEGLADGYAVRKLENIYRVDTDGQYERRLEKLCFSQSQSHKDISLNGVIEEKNIFKELLMISKELELVVSVDIDETQSQELIVGFVEYVSDDEVVVSKISENGEEDGQSIFLLDDICTLNCDAYEERCLQILYRANKNK